jgi:flagellar basal body-associated protein FliL
MKEIACNNSRWKSASRSKDLRIIIIIIIIIIRIRIISISGAVPPFPNMHL